MKAAIFSWWSRRRQRGSISKGWLASWGLADFSFGKPELLMEVLGVVPGAVTAFAVINDGNQRVRLVIDQDLMRHDTINCHPLENTATTNIARDDLMRFIRSCGHEPRIAVVGATGTGGAST